MNYYIAGGISIFIITIITFLLLVFAPESNSFINEVDFIQDLNDIAEYKSILIQDIDNITEWTPHPFSNNVMIAPLTFNTKSLVEQIPEFKCGYFFKIDKEIHTNIIPGNTDCNYTLRAVLGLKVSNERLCSVWVNDEARQFKEKWIILDPSKDNAFINDSFAGLYGISIDLNRPKKIKLGSSSNEISYYEKLK